MIDLPRRSGAHPFGASTSLGALALVAALALVPPARAAETMPPRLPGARVVIPVPLPDSGGRSEGPFFYHGLTYGSESLVHPLRLIENGGFGILQFDNRDNRFSQIRFRSGWDRVTSDLRHPIRAIEQDGWRAFLEDEVLPISVSTRSARYWPNYTLHLVGGGMSFVNMREWYAQHGFVHDGRWALGTLAAYHFLNEVVENDDQPGPTTDAISDLLLFDPAGILLFSHPGVSGFFGRTLHMRDWSNQPAIDFAHGSIENQGQNFSVKWRPRWSGRWSAFYYFGNHGEGGLCWTRDDGLAYSLAAGFTASRLVDLGRGDRTAELLPSAGVFVDRNGSLLFSAMTTRSRRNRVRVNLYPGVLHVRGHSAGLFAVWNDHGVPMAGVTLAVLPLGVAFKR